MVIVAQARLDVAVHVVGAGPALPCPDLGRSCALTRGGLACAATLSHACAYAQGGSARGLCWTSSWCSRGWASPWSPWAGAQA